MESEERKIESTARIDVEVVEFKEGDRFIARWPHLSLSAHGASREEALNSLVNMITAALIASIRRGDLAAMLKTAGIDMAPLLPGGAPPNAETLTTLPHLVVRAHADPRAAA